MGQVEERAIDRTDFTETKENERDINTQEISKGIKDE